MLKLVFFQKLILRLVYLIAIANKLSSAVETCTESLENYDLRQIKIY